MSSPPAVLSPERSERLARHDTTAVLAHGAGLTRWLGVRLQHFVALEMVARAGSVTRAASALGYSQSAVSQQIAALENVAGSRLLERDDRLSPTSAGEIVLRRAHAIRRELSVLQAELDELANRRSATMRIVTHHPAACRFLAEVIGLLRTGPGGSGLVAHVAPSVAAALHALESGAADVALAVVPPSLDDHLVAVPLFDVSIEVVVSSSTPLAADGPLSKGDLAGCRLVCLNDCPATDEVLQGLADAEVPHEVVVRADDEATLVQLARRGAGAALLPSHHPGLAQAADLAHYELVDRHALVVSVVRCVHRPLAEDAAEFVRIARRVAAKRRGARPG